MNQNNQKLNIFGLHLRGRIFLLIERKKLCSSMSKECIACLRGKGVDVPTCKSTGVSDNILCSRSFEN
jgi:hypothetical protein